MTTYTQVRNPASEVGFELAKFLPEAVPLKDKLTPEFLRRLLQHHPQATLAEFRNELKIEFSIEASTTALCRAFKRAGLDRHARSRIVSSSRKAAYKPLSSLPVPVSMPPASVGGLGKR